MIQTIDDLPVNVLIVSVDEKITGTFYEIDFIYVSEENLRANK